MYTRTLARFACATLAFAGILPGSVSASMVMQAQRLRPDAAGAEIGAASAAVSGDWIASFGRSAAAEGNGQVMLYHRNKGVWTYTQTLSPPDAESCMDTLAMSGNMLFVACPRALDLDRGTNMGVVAVYTQSNGHWQLAQTITSATGFFGNPGFGSSLAVSGNQLFVGYTGFMPMANSLVFGDVEVFDISTVPASYQMQILPDASEAYSNFGSNLAVTNGLLAVGANNQNVSGIGASTGAVYTFVQTEDGWFQRSVLTSAHPQPYDNFPSALTFQQSHLVAGSATNGAEDADGTLGAAFTYDGNGGSLSLDDVLMPTESETDTLFGQSLASIGNTVFVGEPEGGIGGHVHIYNSTPNGWAHSSAFIMDTTQVGDELGFALVSDGQTLVMTALKSPESGTGMVYVLSAPPTDQIFGEGNEP